MVEFMKSSCFKENHQSIRAFKKSQQDAFVVAIKELIVFVLCFSAKAPITDIDLPAYIVNMSCTFQDVLIMFDVVSLDSIQKKYDIVYFKGSSEEITTYFKNSCQRIAQNMQENKQKIIDAIKQENDQLKNTFLDRAPSVGSV